MKRYGIKVAGESGMGLMSVGEIIMKGLKRMGFYVNIDREYPSLIKGGHSFSQIDFSTEPIFSLSHDYDILFALDRGCMMEYLPTLTKGGILIHAYDRHHLIPDFKKIIAEREIKEVYLPAKKIAHAQGGNDLMKNMVLLSVLWKVLDFDLEVLNELVREKFASKPKLLEIDLKVIAAAQEAEEAQNLPQIKIEHPTEVPEKIILNGNQAIALGAIHCGTRAYYAYPMSPSSSILTYIANYSKKTGMVVKQAEDEITAAQMTLGSMHAGTRALVATSGGGYDLMTETVSLAGIIECPLVIVIAQRPGPGTGLPTWTAQGDLNLAIHTGHGEFARLVVACSDPTSAFELIQHAMNYAEEFQIPVILLTEKVIAESFYMVDPFKQKEIPIKRGLVTDEEELKKLVPKDRYKITESGISKRWIPGSSEAFYFANGDEHQEDGTLTERAEPAKEMIAKRVRKEEALKEALPDPEIIGVQEGADISFIGWGSSKNVMKDTIKICEEKGIKVNYLHYEYLWPFKEEKADKFFQNNKNVHLIEGNYRGQLGQLVEDKTNHKFKEKFLKWNGRPFFVDEVEKYVKEKKQ